MSGDHKIKNQHMRSDRITISVDEMSVDAAGNADGTSALRAAVGWTYRGYLPHFDDQETPQFITFRLADSLPAHVIEEWKRELKLTESSDQQNPSETAKAHQTLRSRVEKYLDSGCGSCLLRQPEHAAIVARALQHFDGDRYRLYAWVIMPNHVHALCRQNSGWELSTLVRNWKSFTAHAINRSAQRSGPLWQADYFDRYIRNETHFLTVAHDIETNPVTAGLCSHISDWPWSSIFRNEVIESSKISGVRDKNNSRKNMPSHSGRDVRAPENP